MIDLNVIVSTVASAALLAGIMVSPYSISSMQDSIKIRQLNDVQEANAQRTLNIAVSEYNDAYNAFIDWRTFDISNLDVRRIKEAFDSMPGMSLMQIQTLDSKYQYVDDWHEGDKPFAVKYVLVVDNFETAMKLLDVLQLPIKEVMYSSPNTLEVTVFMEVVE